MFGQSESSNYAQNYPSAVPAFLWFHIVTHLKHYESTTYKTGSEYFHRKNRENFISQSSDYVWNHREFH